MAVPSERMVCAAYKMEYTRNAIKIEYVEGTFLFLYFARKKYKEIFNKTI